MKTFLTKLAILLFFIVAAITGWAAFAMVFPASIFNVLLGVVAIFFITQALDLIDKLNKMGTYSPDDHTEQERPNRGPRHRHIDEEETPEETEVE